MKINKSIQFFKHPESDSETDFVIQPDSLLDKNSGKEYQILGNMVDILGTFDEAIPEHKKGVMFALNAFYSHRVDPWILSTIFAGGGIGFIKADRKLKRWIDEYLSENDVLFIEPENQRHLSFVDPDKCLSVKDYSQKNVEPLPEEYPDLNASPQQLPIRSSSFHSVISNFVFEHITHPRLHLQEIARILKPGGYAIITGPGDVYPSHKVPYNYFNIIRYGYHEMFRENDLELVMEHFPARSWMSILYLVYITTVRNSWFNTNQFTKLLHMVVFGLSTVVFPPLNLLAVLLDLMTPFDKRVYGIYMAVIKKPIGGG